MHISELKKGFFGYQKESVYQYISLLNEEIAQKLAEKEQKNEALIQDLQKQNAALRQKIEVMEQENQQFRQMHSAVSNSIIDAQNYAAQLKMETQKQEQALREQMEAEIARQQNSLKAHIEQIDDFRSHLKAMLEQVDSSLQQSRHQAASLIQQNLTICTENIEYEQESPPPEANMAMFQRKGKNNG